MPRAVNQEVRRRQLTDALMRITADRGLDEVSIRQVASEAGVSIGTVQHYFGTKDDLLLFAFERVADQVVDRIAAIDRGGSVREVLRRVLHELLPLDQPRTVEALVWLAFAARAAVSPPLAAVQARTLARLRGAFTQCLEAAQGRGELPGWVDPATEAAVLTAVLDGLALHIVTDRAGMPPQTAEAVLDAHLDRLFPAE